MPCTDRSYMTLFGGVEHVDVRLALPAVFLCFCYHHGGRRIGLDANVRGVGTGDAVPGLWPGRDCQYDERDKFRCLTAFDASLSDLCCNPSYIFLPGQRDAVLVLI